MQAEPIDLPAGPPDAAVPPVSRLRPDVLARVVLTLLFTGIQAWAITIAVLSQPFPGVARPALAAVLAASVLLVVDSWRDVWAAARRTEQPQWGRPAAPWPR